PQTRDKYIEYNLIDIKYKNGEIFDKIKVNQKTIRNSTDILVEETGVSRDEISNQAELKSLVRYGEHLLYPDDTLYRKYDILYTFYKNMTILFVISGLSYFILSYLIIEGTSLIGVSPRISNVDGPILAWVGLLFLSISTVCYKRQDDWRKRKNRAFFNDLCIKMENK
ncbi:MAG: hypothetical protein U9O06_12925, partial [Euryarchaeota archaeon]|nr:hypothetical protein [Euryarchaeota archaeon]